jgi:hypothetical protein
MVNSEWSTDSGILLPVPAALKNEAWTSPRARTRRQVVAKRHRRFDPVRLGFWLGGLTLGAVGCIVGASMPYHHPLAIAISAIWWGIYVGCFGGSIGALIGLCARRRSSDKCSRNSYPHSDECA